MKNKAHAIRENEIPSIKEIPEGTDPKTLGLPVIVDGLPAKILIAAQESRSSEKVVIEFDNDHPRWGYTFLTKYFEFTEPGNMSWGHDGEKMEIFKA